MRQSQVKLSDVELHVTEVGAGPPLLLVHGFPLDHEMWQRQLDGLASQFRVIAPDLRGFGQSSVTPGTISMARYADDMAELLDVLGVQQPANFCGLSMGGYIAWQFVERHRAKLGKLVLCDTRSVADSTGAAQGRIKNAERVIDEGAAFLADSMLPKLFSPDSHAYLADTVAKTKAVILRTPRAGIAAALRGMAERPDMTSSLPQINVPTLLLCGQHDAIAPPAEIRQISLAMPNATYVEISAAGHMAPLEQPAAVNAALVHFLAD